MLKKKALRKNRIALFLAAMLIFCVLGTDGVMACDTANRATGRADATVLEYPGAGGFFTDSLPKGERESVREVSADWQSIAVVRSVRAGGIKSGPKGTGVSVTEPEGLQKVTVCGESPGEDARAAIPCCREIIVCYIHNQDGAKG